MRWARNYKLSESLKSELSNIKICNLEDATNQEASSIQNQRWETKTQLGQHGELAEWKHCTSNLKRNAIRLSTVKADIIWAEDKPSGLYTTNLGLNFEARMKDIEGERLVVETYMEAQMSIKMQDFIIVGFN